MFRGQSKVDVCGGADMMLLRESLDMIDVSRKNTPLRTGTAQGSFPRPSGTLLPIFGN